MLSDGQYISWCDSSVAFLADEHEDEAVGKMSTGRKDGRDGKLGKRAKHDDDSDAASDDAHGSPSRTSRRGASSNKSSRQKLPLTKNQELRNSTYKRMFDWLSPTFKMNGKKLIANSTVVWRFMVS